MTQIEKGKLISSLNRLSNSVAENEESPISVGKDTKLLSILQVNPQEIVEAEARMREILDKVKVERGYSDDNSYQGSLAFNGAAPSSNAYFDNREERLEAFERDEFDYYVCGLKITGEDYTVKFVISKKANGVRYYDHKLTEIEKGKLLDLPEVSRTGSAESSPLNSKYKDKRLISILQTNPEEIAEAESRMREILDRAKQEKGYSDDSSYQGSLAFNGAAPSKNGYYATKEERRKLLPIVWVVKPHLKSIAAVPQMIENAIYISELPNEKGNGKYDSYRYYVTGMRIGGEDYTAKIVIGVDENGNKYYDHSLTEIEKGKLIDEVGALSTTLPSDNESPYLSVGKDTKLLSILQVNPQEIVEAEARMREILDKVKVERQVVEAFADHLNAIGVGASTDWETGQRVLDEVNGENTTLSKAQKRAVETVSVSSNEEHLQTVISTAAGAKVRIYWK